MKRHVFILVFCLLLASIFAVQVSSNEAASIATNWMNQISNTNSISSIEPITNPEYSNNTDFYVVNFSQGGFLILSGDDSTHPILGYDTLNSFTTSELPDNLKWFLSQYHKQYNLIRGQNISSVNDTWQSIRNNNFTGFIPTRAVSPLLQTNWDQDWPYNSLCPSSLQGPGGHVYAGCAATAMGQIMKFWQHPTQGTGSHSYTHQTYGTLSANFGATTYNFSSMPNSLNWSSNNALSTLLLHCGIALNMDYGPDGSGAYVNAVRGAFVNYFSYETTISTLYRSSYTATNWDNLLKAELENGRPIFYFGTDTSSGGHAFVCDGYQGTNYFHMNWGWSGSSNGYFYVANLDPGMYEFNSQQGAVLGIEPAVPVVAPSNLIASIDFDNNVLLQWDFTGSRALQGYSIYRNNTIIDIISPDYNNSYYDINLLPGTYHYYVIANYSQGNSEPSNTATATVYPPPVINYQESFESFANYNTVLLPWRTYDLDLSPTVQISEISFPSEGTPLSFMVLKPSALYPVPTEISAFSGQQILACFGAVNSINNDWIVSPKWNTGAIGKLRFWAKSAYADSSRELIKIGVSTTSPAPTEMTIISGHNPIEVPNVWTEFDFTLTDYLDTNVFVGIQCVSNNGYMLLLDRIQLWTSFVENEDAYISPEQVSHLDVYPNPFTAYTKIVWKELGSAPASLKIYDIKGQLVKTLLTQQNPSTSISWNGLDNNGKKVANGIYYTRLIDKAGKTYTRKLVKLK